MPDGHLALVDHAQANYNRAVVYIDLGLRERAISDYDEALRLNPKLPEAYNRRARVRFELGELVTAVDDVSEALRLDPRYAKAYTCW